MMKKTALIYMGGTFGCVGHPLFPMQASEFIPRLREYVPASVDCLMAPSIKDSSACHASDWLGLIAHIQQLQQQDYQYFVIIHGTDTLSYAAAVASHLLAQSAHVIFTGSQYPLLNAKATALHANSDALDNLTFALDQLSQVKPGVYVAFCQQLFYGHSTYKQHTSELNAFGGIATAGPLQQPQSSLLVSEQHIEKSVVFNCISVMLQPIDVQQQVQMLASLLFNPPDCLILQAFGSGNFAINPEILKLFIEFKQKNCAVVLTTQVLNGGLSQHYAVSDWLQNSPILISDSISHADLYAKACKMYLQYADVNQWYQHWSDPA